MTIRALWPIAALLLFPSAANAGDPLWVVGGQYSIPLRWSGTVDLLVPTTGPRERIQKVVAFGVEGGLGGGRVTMGLGRFTEGLYGVDARVTVAQTSSHPRFAIKRATHVGVDVGLTTPIVRVTLGVARRLTGSDPAHQTVITGSVGIVVPLRR